MDTITKIMGTPLALGLALVLASCAQPEPPAAPVTVAPAAAEPFEDIGAVVAERKALTTPVLPPTPSPAPGAEAPKPTAPKAAEKPKAAPKS